MEKLTHSQLTMIHKLLNEIDSSITAQGAIIMDDLVPRWKIRMYHKSTTIALIRRGILIPEISNEEFKVQQALGSMEHRLYYLANRKRWRKFLKNHLLEKKL